MEPIAFELTLEQKNILATISRKTGKPVPALLDEALDVLQEHEKAAHRFWKSLEAGQRLPDAAQTPRKPFWQKALEASQRIPDAELDHLPPNLAAQVDRHIYGTPKR